MILAEKESYMAQRLLSLKASRQRLLPAEPSKSEKHPVFFKTNIDLDICTRRSAANAQNLFWSHHGNNH
jgi:hypothetical protein